MSRRGRPPPRRWTRQTPGTDPRKASACPELNTATDVAPGKPEPSGPGLFDECQASIESGFPAAEGFPGAAAMLLADDTVLVGTAPEVLNAGVELCHETEPFCAAYRMGQRLVASICLARHPDGRYLVLNPCGVCRERLAIHGPGVMVAVAHPDDPTTPTWKRLKDVHLDYWVTPAV
ncbi:cytidine deaminase [uncultured Corynebacterium sp.]|uniref:cytidine deaminase n=1 Tax=uncultured Corynebacterium sp. TaxID=159447 RepID=UPI0025D3C78D|nr:cytidine deaminase [uncultured Corynebacterium sp.]